jgi:hypothetical protein
MLPRIPELRPGAVSDEKQLTIRPATRLWICHPPSPDQSVFEIL